MNTSPKSQNVTTHNMSVTGVSKQKASNKKRPVVTKSGRIVMLTPSQKAYADAKLLNPNKSLLTVAAMAYPNQKPTTLSQQIQQNEKNQDIRIYNDEQFNKAALTVVELLDSSKEDVKFRAATDILDRTYGKATQKVQSNTTNTNINIEASKELADQFQAYLKQNTAS